MVTESAILGEDIDLFSNPAVDLMDIVYSIVAETSEPSVDRTGE